jgi:hypothetical protein
MRAEENCHETGTSQLHARRSLLNLLKRTNKARKIGIYPCVGAPNTHKPFPFYPADIAMLQAHPVVMVSQLFETHLSKGID